MRPTASTAAAAAAAAVFAGVAHALDPAPVSLQASDWLGIDGNWSTVSFLLGSDSEVVNVLLSTTLSEFWAIGPGGCVDKDPHCNNARGGIYNPNKSKHWTPMGLWQLGLQYFGYNDNGEYGLDTVNAYSPITNIAFGMSNVLMSAINTTSPFLGFFGLGIQQGRFGDLVADSPITQAVKTFGWIPSYSYGYTAGAHYRNTVVSATLGGYDSARLVQHDTAFTLTQGESIPRTLVRGIQLASNKTHGRLGVGRSTEVLSDWNTSFTAMIDSSTPYLWLPEPICNRFAEVLNLTYNNTLELYTLPNDLYRQYSANNSLIFTFSLTSFDNHDNFGSPLEVPGLVNITVPLQAFVSLLQYPFGRGIIKYGDPAVPYFTLKKSQNDTFIIGRTFLQESYLITKFDEALYSIHQALFPANPLTDAQLIPIRQPSNSPYPPPPSPKSSDDLTTAQMAGIAVGAVLLCVVVLAAFYYYRRRRRVRKGKTADEADDHNDSASTLAPDSPKTPVSKILSKIACRKLSSSRRTIPGTADGVAHGRSDDASGVAQMPSEAPDCQIFELAASVAPVELDAGSDNHSIEETELGTVNSQHMSTYELARRKIERQLRGPVPEYTPPADGTLLRQEKAIPDPGPSEARPAMDHPSPSSPTRSAGGDWGSSTYPMSEPSPVSPRAEWSTRSTLPPSPVTGSLASKAYHGSTGSQSHPADTASAGTSRSHQSDRSTAATSTAESDAPPRPSSHRTHIDASKVVCLGPLPENYHIQRQNLVTRLVGPDGRTVSMSMFNANSLPSEGSLGSNYTEEEDRIVEEMTRQASLSQVRSSQSYYRSPSHKGGDERPCRPPDVEESMKLRGAKKARPAQEQGKGRIDAGRDLIHVPQMADKRYSWEDQ
ncbi:hypothetical protein CDD83_6081 [Cordyceps sp. RAO-2017]|nr:hypothetical protein CDD83_6081 [Cordyceps sp. RAO-2017]